jgi:hypothetical protein
VLGTTVQHGRAAEPETSPAARAGLGDGKVGFPVLRLATFCANVDEQGNDLGKLQDCDWAL